jgi:hypothetical protein
MLLASLHALMLSNAKLNLRQSRHPWGSQWIALVFPCLIEHTDLDSGP